MAVTKQKLIGSFTVKSANRHVFFSVPLFTKFVCIYYLPWIFFFVYLFLSNIHSEIDVCLILITISNIEGKADNSEVFNWASSFSHKLLCTFEK